MTLAIEWVGGDIVALVAVVATMVAISANYFAGKRRLKQEAKQHNKRLDHEAELHASRLAHERKEALRTTAAVAYTKASEALTVLNPDYVVGTRRMEAMRLGLPPFADASTPLFTIVDGAKRELQIITAVGWSDEVQAAASAVLNAITALHRKAGAVADRFAAAERAAERDPKAADSKALGKAEQQLDQVYLTAGDALEAYRKVIAAED